MADRLEQLLKLHAADPADPFCTYGIALEHAKQGRTDDALGWLDKTLAADAGYCYAYFQKGKLLAERGDGAAARIVLERGINAARAAKDPHAEAELMSLLESVS